MRIPLLKAYATIAKYVFKNIPYRPPEVIGRKKFMQYFKSANLKRTVLITDEVLFSLGLHESIVKELEEEGNQVAIFKEVEADPCFETVEKGIEFCKAHNFDSMIALGGGSVLDASKVINPAATHARNPMIFKGMFKVLRKGKLFAAIPTTAGTGSEMTVVSVITDRNKQTKETVIDPKILPDYAVLIPELLTGLPRSISAQTGIDAFSHAFEAYASRYATSITDEKAELAIKMIFENLAVSVEEGQDIQYRLKMLEASNIAGQAFTQTSVGWVHAITHQIGAIYHLPHGMMIGMVICDIVAYYIDVIPHRLARLGRIIGVAHEHETETQAAEAFLKALEQLVGRLGIERSHPAIKQEDLPLLAKRAFDETLTQPYGVPKYFASEKDLEVFLERFIA